MSEIVLVRLSEVQTIDPGATVLIHKEVSLTGAEIIERLHALDPTLVTHAIILDDEELELKVDEDGKFLGLIRHDHDDYQATRWWRVMDQTGDLWLETSDVTEARNSIRPGDQLQRRYEHRDFEWRDET